MITKSGLGRMHCNLQVKKRVATHPMFDEEDASVATALAEYSSLLLAASLRGSHREKNLIYTQRLNALWYTFLRVSFQASKLAQCTPLALHIITMLLSRTTFSSYNKASLAKCTVTIMPMFVIASTLLALYKTPLTKGQDHYELRLCC